jgi:hypothetical protein
VRHPYAWICDVEQDVDRLARPNEQRVLPHQERELHEWLDGGELEIVELPHDGRIVRIVQRKTLTEPRYRSRNVNPRRDMD